MKKITLVIMVSLMSFLGFAQGLPLQEFNAPWTVNGLSPEPAPPGWIVINHEGPQQKWMQTVPGNASQVPYLGVGFSAYLNREDNAPGPIPSDWLITEQFNMPSNPELNFVSRLTINGDNGGVYKILMLDVTASPTANPADVSSYTLLKTYTETELSPSSTFLPQKYILPTAAAGHDVRIAFVMEANFKDRWFLDNIEVVQQCLPPTTLTANPVTMGTTTAELSWTSPGVTKWDIEIVLDSQSQTGVGVEYTGTLPYLKTGLLECTSYKYFVRAKCSGGGISAWQGPFFFKTRCLGENCASPLVIPPTLPYSTSNNTAAFTDFYEGTPGTGCVGTGNYLAGNDVVYSFTPAVTGTLNIALSNTGGPAGMFIYSSCANIGVNCLAGAVASATAIGEIPAFAAVAGTTYYIVISTNGTPQTTNYTLTIQQAACAKPTAGTGVGAATSANLSWTPGTVGATSWQVAVQPVNSGVPTGAGQTASVNTNYAVTTTNAGVPLTVATAYEFYVREACATPANTFSIWAGPFLFSTTQEPSPLPYVQNFDGATHGWGLNNGAQINKWFVGAATSNSPSKSLYISNDNGLTNAYTTTSASVVHAYKDVMLPLVVSDLSLSFDWKCLGENNTDYIRVWFVPASFTPTPGQQITTANSGGIQVGGNLGQSGTFWNTATNVINVAAMANTPRRLVFEWRNNASSGTQPPAAIDNVNLKVITCPQPTGLAIGTLSASAVPINWVAPAPAPGSYDLYYSTTSNTPPTATTPATVDNITSPTYTIGDPIPSATYYVWVRSDCSTEQSFWTGPVSFNTPQVAATMTYEQNFDLGGPHNFTLSNGTQPNKWFVGTATFNSPGSSLYVSENNGVANTYNTNAASIVHAYRDIEIPQNIDQLLLKFDWKCAGEGTSTLYDYINVWLVPLTYSPTAGTQITAANSGGIKVGASLNLSSTWKTSTNILTVPTFSNSTRRLVFEWNNDPSIGEMPAGAIDNIHFSVIKCKAPTGLALQSMALGSATFNWVAPTPAPASYDYYISTSTTPPADSEAGINVPTGTTATAGSLLESTNYNIWVRSHCGGADGNSFWVGPLNILTPQTPATLDYTQNFDAGAHGWALNNGTQTNKWVVGSATSNSPANSLYISNDNGVTNAYTIGTSSVVQAYRDVMIPANVEQLLLSFDWKNVGENNTDYVRVWMVPITYNLVPGTQITAAADRVQVGGNFGGSATWKNSENVIFVNQFSPSTRRLVFEWRNNDFTGTQPPAAIDNINLKVITCPQPSNLVLTGTTTTTTAAFSWTAPLTTTPTYDIYYSTDPTAPTATTVPNGGTAVPGTTGSLSSLEDGVNYNVWVRSNCGPGGTSLWIGPLSFDTQQIPADLNYVQDFDGVAPHKWKLNNGTQANKWFVGTATFNSPGKSLYISNDNGVSNAYDTGITSVTQAYRDIMIPIGANMIDVSFDWKALGEGTLTGTMYDYIRVWVVPTTFIPTPGTQITPAADRLQLGTSLNQNANWKNALYVYNSTAVAVTGGPVRLVFEWRNDGSGGTPPPGAIDNIDVRVLTCPQPTALQVLERTMTTAKLAWTEAGTAPSWEVYVVPAGQPAPTATTDGEDAATNPYVVTNLQPGKQYQYYVRSICSTTDKSRWSGPFAFNTTICEPVDQCMFDFILTDSGNNGWQGNTMRVTQNGILVGTLGPQITNGGPITVSLPLCSGIPFEVFWVNGKNSTPTGSNYSQIGLQIVNPFNGQTVFNRVAGSPALNMGTVIYKGMAYCQTVTCPQPTSLASESVPNAPNTTKLSWSANGTETQWEVVYQPQGAGFPSATPPQSIIVDGEPKTVISNLVSGQPYEYYVRAICGPNNKSFWSGPLYFSIFTPPACADVTVLDPDLVIVAPDTEYVICAGEELNIDFKASYFHASETTSYGVESIPYALPFPATGGTKMDVTTDDQWAPVAELPFEFCFFGQVYTRAQVGSNGVISFDANFETGAFCPWDFNNATIPSTTFPIKNAIYGVYQDIDVTKLAGAFAHPEINYQVIGNYPCRAFVVNFSDIAQFGSGCNTDPAVGAQASQVVIYEVTNIIEVYVKNRVACTTWTEGDGVIGIQNGPGTVAFTPPGRNTGPWNAQLEAWRFTPNGAVSTSTFEWLKDGDHYSNDTDITVTAVPAGITTMTARATYSLCNGEEMLRESKFVIKVQEEIITADLKNLIGCGNGEDVTFNLNNSLVDIVTPENYTFTFYTTQAAALLGGNDNIATTYVTNQTVTLWVRILKNGTPCSTVKSFTITIANNPPQFSLPADFSLCAGTSGTISVVPDAPTLPGGFDLADATYTWTHDGDPLPDTTPTITVTTGGVYAVTVNKSGCINTKSTEVTITPIPVVDVVTDVNECGSYTLLPLTSGNYFEQTGGVGPLSAGDVISSTKTIYIYAASGTTPNCTAESSFVVTIVPTPVVADVADVVECDTYTLPVLTVGNYFTETGGAGTMLNAGDVFNTVGVTTVYVYAANGTAPNICSDEKSFTITITGTPVVDTPANVAQCVSYELPALTSGSYFTGPNGTGTPLAVGTSITSTQTVYVFKQTGDCTAQASFTVTIIPSAVITTEKGCDGNVYNVKVVFDKDGAYNEDNVTIKWTNSVGALVGSDAVLAVTETGIYTVTVTPNGGVECPVSSDVNVDSTTCDIPRGISPNGDGMNDEFDLTTLKVRKLSIFNRYGQEVYKKANYTKEWIGQGSNGDQLPTGTYFYMIEREGGESVTGWVYINRQE